MIVAAKKSTALARRPIATWRRFLGTRSTHAAYNKHNAAMLTEIEAHQRQVDAFAILTDDEP